MADPTDAAPGALRSHHRWDGPAVPWGVRVGVRALCATISLLVIVASGVAWATFHDFTGSIPHGEAAPDSGKDADGSDQNILLIGNDTRAGATKAELKALHTGDDTTTVNADTMMLMHVPAAGGRPTLVSFPRDAWVDIPGHGMGKMNSAYPDAYNDAKADGRSEVQAQSAGILATARTISALTGLRVDHYMQVNLLGFYRISNAIGGVEVCLNAAQNRSTETDDTGRSGFSGIDLPKGVSTIAGAQALAFVRQRHGLPHGDLDRVKRQQYFLKAAFTKMTTGGVLLNPFKLRRLLTAVGSSLLTDPGLDLLQLARQFQSLTAGRITFATLPNNGPKLIHPDGVDTAIVEVNRKAIPAFVDQLQGKNDDALKKATPAARRTVTVDVLNGTDTARLASRNADGLLRLGFKVATVGSTSQTARTTVEYPPGQEARARALLAVVPHAVALATPDVPRVTLVVGGNGAAVRGVAVPRPSPSTSGSASATAPSSAAAHGLGCID